MRPPPPAFRNSHVHRDAIQPGVKRAGSRKAIELQVSAEKRLLGGVVSIVDRSAHVPQRATEPILVLPHERAIGFSISAPRGGQELGFVRRWTYAGESAVRANGTRSG